jgi:hypothetical protein
MLSRSSPLETKPLHSNALYLLALAPKLFPYSAIADSYVPLLKGWTQLFYCTNVVVGRREDFYEV